MQNRQPHKKHTSYSAGEAISKDFRCGLISLAGRPNVGKSTLLNCLLKQKISITSKKANTTRHRILGVLSEPRCQFVFADLPGFNTGYKSLVGRSIHKTAVAGINDTDLIVFLIESRGWHSQDTAVWKRIQAANFPVIIALSKIDKLKNKDQLLPVIQDVSKRTGVTSIVPVSALKSENILSLKEEISRQLPQSLPLFPSNVVTDRDEFFQATELIREQIFRFYGEEIPYISAVQLEKFEQLQGTLHLHALIWVESNNQKRIIIGSKGEKLKLIGTRVRQILESQFNCKVYVKLWVKIRSQWTDDQHLISLLGYSNRD